MFEFHNDRQWYFNMQYLVSKNYILPFVKHHTDFSKNLKILEIGCAEAGVLKAFTENGHLCTGIELHSSRLEYAKKFMAKELADNKIQFIHKNIYDIQVDKDIPHKYDIIILKDVIEHIPDQHIFIHTLKDFLAPNGKIFFGFPPWQMPFGGHQQMCQHKIAAFCPYIHLLPKAIYKLFLKMAGEKTHTINELIAIKNCGISIERFEKLLNDANFTTLHKTFYFINPIYQYKFGLKARRQSKLLSRIPYVRNFFTSAAFYIVESC